MRSLQSILLLGLLFLTVAPSARAQNPLEQQPRVGDPDGGRRGAFLLATVATVGPGVAGAIMATEEAPLTADETGVLLASGGLLFGPTLGYVANQDWRGAMQGTAIRLAGAGVTAWIASADEYDATAVIPASFVALVAIMDLVDLSRQPTPAEASRLSLTPGYDPQRGSVSLTARGSF